MDERVRAAIDGGSYNYILPFYWQHGDHREHIRAQIADIAASGARAFCVESRPHPDFCGDSWWGDMDIILDEAAKRSMKVWILDDSHFPTGYANGLCRAKYPQYTARALSEFHLDVIGPMSSAAFIVPTLPETDNIVGIYAYKRAAPVNGAQELLEFEHYTLTDHTDNGLLYWDVPDGMWRIFFVSEGKRGISPGHRDYIDMLTTHGTDVLLEAVYEPHFQHYGKLFGSVIAGFFSDEPSFGNDWAAGHTSDFGMYDRRVGMPGLGLPWRAEASAKMKELISSDIMCPQEALNATPEELSPLLWYDCGEYSPFVRSAYMDAVTTLWRDNFSRRLGDWCRSRNAMYIGHIIEDMNAHARLGCSAGHYFRSLDGQDMSGMDIVLHQVMPGAANYPTAASCSGGMVDPSFFHYVLPKLCASLSHINKNMAGRAMCEVFGAYGWAEGVPQMKWLADFLLVRGINHFVPHAFTSRFPDGDCPPHFCAEGHDPQFEAFSSLMDYMNRVSHILCGARHIAGAALLYHAEGEWMNDSAMTDNAAAKILYDNHIDFDILPADFICDDDQCTASAGKLCSATENWSVLIVPMADYLPDKLTSRLQMLSEHGVKVIFLDNAPVGCGWGDVCELDFIVPYLLSVGIGDVKVPEGYPLLRIYHAVRASSRIYMFSNEELTKACRCKVKVKDSGWALKLEPALGSTSSVYVKNGVIELSLEPYESCIFVFDDYSDDDIRAFPPLCAPSCERKFSPVWNISVKTDDDLAREYDKRAENGNNTSSLTVNENFNPLFDSEAPFNVNSAGHLPNFAGQALASCTITLNVKSVKRRFIALDGVYVPAELTLNGKTLGIRMCPPYVWEITDVMREGENSVSVRLMSTLAYKLRDGFSRYMPLPPLGIGGMRLLCE